MNIFNWFKAWHRRYRLSVARQYYALWKGKRLKFEEDNKCPECYSSRSNARYEMLLRQEAKWQARLRSAERAQSGLFSVFEK